MPRKHENQHPLLRQLPSALRARMERDGLSQPALSKRLFVAQWEISRALNGKRKRLTDPMRALCRYAGLLSEEEAAAASHAKLNALMGELVGGNAAAAQIVEGVLLSLAPVLAQLSVRHEFVAIPRQEHPK